MSTRVGQLAKKTPDKVYTASRNTSDPDAMNNIDTADNRGVYIAMGIAGSGALTTANTMGFSIQHSDTTTAADYDDVDLEDIEGGAADGELVRLTTAPTGTHVAHAAYLGDKRYLRIGPKKRGSVSGNYTFICAVVLDNPRSNNI